jgi:hypothetical protein
MRTGFFLLAAAAGLTALFIPQAASAQVTHCAVFNSTTNTTIAAQSTTSETFVDVAGTSIVFTTTGEPIPDARGLIATQSCAIVQVTAQVRAAEPRIARIRVVMNDGTTIIAPAPATLYTAQNRFDQRTVRFVLRNVPGGVHTLKVQFASDNGGAVALSKVITTVHYNNAL